MVKVNYEGFVSKVDTFFSEAKDKRSIYFTFKRVYSENYKYKRNNKARKLRREDHFTQESDKSRQYSVLCRVKLQRKKIQCIVDPKNLNAFHNILMKIFSLHFITSSDENTSKAKVTDVKKKSKTQKRKEKKLKKLGARKGEGNKELIDNKGKEVKEKKK
jgi:hypothetical protein